MSAVAFDAMKPVRRRLRRILPLVLAQMAMTSGLIVRRQP